MPNLNRREVIAGTATVAAAAAVSAMPGSATTAAATAVAVPVAPPALWPMATQAQRQMLIVSVIKEYIAEIEDRAEETVTTDDIHHRGQYFGMSHDDVVAAVQGIARRGKH